MTFSLKIMQVSIYYTHFEDNQKWPRKILILTMSSVCAVIVKLVFIV